MRDVCLKRKTNETDISLFLNLDGTGAYDNQSGCGFLDHMLDLFARHGRFDLTVTCKGDTEIDYHHTVEDIGITLGQAFQQALGEKKGIRRYGDIILPMDETLILCAADISGRGHLSYNTAIPTAKVGDFDTELVEEFLLGFTRSFGITLHIAQLAGTNSHHIIEGVFKALGRVLGEAVSIDPRLGDEVPSTKGMLG